MMYSRYNLDLDYKIPTQAQGKSQKLTVSLKTVIKIITIVFVNLIKMIPGDRNQFLSVDYWELSVIAKTRGFINERGNDSAQ